MVVFDSAAIYVESKKTAREKIIAIDAIIDALLSTALKAASAGDVTEFSLDDGQSKVKTIFRSPMEVMKSIEAFKMLKQEYMNTVNGRVMRMIDGKSFTRRRNGYNNGW